MKEKNKLIKKKITIKFLQTNNIYIINDKKEKKKKGINFLRIKIKFN